MGFFSDIGDTLFGDQGAGQAQAQAQQNIGDRRFSSQIFSGARADVNPLFDIGQRQQALSSQQSLDVLGGSIPAQLQAFQQGGGDRGNAKDWVCISGAWYGDDFRDIHPC